LEAILSRSLGSRFKVLSVYDDYVVIYCNPTQSQIRLRWSDKTDKRGRWEAEVFGKTVFHHNADGLAKKIAALDIKELRNDYLSRLSS